MFKEPVFQLVLSCAGLVKNNVIVDSRVLTLDPVEPPGPRNLPIESL